MFIALFVLSICLGNLSMFHSAFGWCALVCGVGAMASMAVSARCVFGGGVADWIHGGGAWISEFPLHVSWTDWSIITTRTGKLDIDTGVLSLRESVFFGLITQTRREWHLGELDRVETAERRPEDESLTVVTHEVKLVDKEGRSHVVMDLTASTTGVNGVFAAREINRLATALQTQVEEREAS